MKIIILKTARDYIFEYYLNNFINDDDEVLLYANDKFNIKRNNIKIIRWGPGNVPFFYLFRLFFVECDKIIFLSNNKKFKGYTSLLLFFFILFNKKRYVFYPRFFTEDSFSFFIFISAIIKKKFFIISNVFLFLYYNLKILASKKKSLKNNYIFFADEHLSEPLVYKQGLFFVHAVKNFKNKIVCSVETVNNLFYPIDIKEIQRIKKELKDIIFYQSYLFEDSEFLTNTNIFNKACRLIFKYAPKTVHCRRIGFMPALLKLKKIYDFKLIFDPRGDILSEEVYKETWKKNIDKFYRFKKFWFECFKTSDKILVVTNEWKKEILKKNPELKNIYVIPAGLNKIYKKEYLMQKRAELREKYCLDSKIILGYSGSIAKWQQMGFIVDLVQQLIKKYTDIFFIGFCYPFHLKIQVEERFKNKNISENFYKILCINPEEIIEYLSMLDCGLLFRKKGRFSKIAFPIKISEYLATGNFLITNDSMPEVSKVIKNLNIGMIIDENNFNIDLIYSKISKLNKSGLLDKGIKYCSEYRLLDNYKKLYNEIITQ